MFHDELAAEFADWPDPVQEELLAHAKLLAEFGPSLGRPRVDTLKGSRIANLKELRFAAEGRAWRVAFAFDANRIAVLHWQPETSGQSRSTVLPLANCHGGAALRHMDCRRIGWA